MKKYANKKAIVNVIYIIHENKRNKNVNTKLSTQRTKQKTWPVTYFRCAINQYFIAKKNKHENEM